MTVSPRVTFFIYCEGRRTEPEYIRALVDAMNLTATNVNIIAPVGVAKTVASQAVAARRKLFTAAEGAETSLLDSENQFWAAFDCDEEEEPYATAKRQCMHGGVRLATSNPCFELWLLLHFECFNKPDAHRTVEKRLRLYCSEYHPRDNKTVNFELLRPNVELAEKHAERLFAEREADGSLRPETYFGRLTKALRYASAASAIPKGVAQIGISDARIDKQSELGSARQR